MESLARLHHRRAAGRVGLGYGGDYNPEQWDESVWLEDARLMREAGVSFVTLAVFAWARIEPRPGVRDLDWLDRVMGLMDAHDIAVDLATATASPPAWLVHRHPEVLPVDRDGRTLGFGGRQAWCPSSPVFREHALRLVGDLATRYAGHPALAMWHVSNELGCHNAHCYCPTSAAAYRAWLRDRYGDLDGLNRAWGTSFWSQAYADWEHVEPPRAVTAIVNPTQRLDFQRFSSDALLAHYRAERDVLHRLSPGVPVTTNFMVTHHIDGLDYGRWAPEQDVISNDHYLDSALADPHVELAFCADWTRGLAAGEPWVLMEHSTSAVNWQPRNERKQPGQMRRNALQHVARGADTVGFFQWRASLAGAERYHSAMVPHAGTDTRIWREVVELGEILGRLGEVAGTTTEARVALVLDTECRWAVEGDALPVSGLSYLGWARRIHQALWERGVAVDVRAPGEDLASYAAVVAPLLHLVRDGDAAALAAYVEGGGHLLLTWFSGVADPDLHVRPGGYPGAFRDLLGIVVEEFVPLAEPVRLEGGIAGRAEVWAEDLRLEGATEIARYAEGPVGGVPALTRHQTGPGVAWYLATMTDAATTGAVLDRVLADAGIAVGPTPPGVEVVRRVGGGRAYTFVLNHTAAVATLPVRGTDLVRSGHVGPDDVVEPYGVAVIREES